jgi:hypothetical protein
MTTADQKRIALTNLAHKHAKGNIFITAYAIRALAQQGSTEAWLHRDTPQYEEMCEAVEGMFRSYRAVAMMFDLHVEQEEHKHYRELPFWKRWFTTAVDRKLWQQAKYDQLEREAVRIVYAILKGESL